jgi:hypothetical protein
MKRKAARKRSGKKLPGRKNNGGFGIGVKDKIPLCTKGGAFRHAEKPNVFRASTHSLGMARAQLSPAVRKGQTEDMWKAIVGIVILIAVLFIFAGASGFLTRASGSQQPAASAQGGARADAPPTYAAKTYSGVFDGAASPTITVGGNCPPTNEKIEITGMCGGIAYKDGDCSSLPKTDGIFVRHEIYGSCTAVYGCGAGGCSYTASFGTGETCAASYSYSTFSSPIGRSDTCCAYGCRHDPRCCGAYSCTATSYVNQGGASATCNGGARTYYKLCTKDPSIAINGKTWKYSGIVNDITTVPIKIDNLQLGTNTLTMSASLLNKFKYAIYWTECYLGGPPSSDITITGSGGDIVVK